MVKRKKERKKEKKPCVKSRRRRVNIFYEQGEGEKKNKNNARAWEIIRSSNQIRRWDKFFISMLTAGILIKIELLTDQQFTVSAIGK